MSDAAESAPSLDGNCHRVRIPEGEPESLLELVCMKRWAQAVKRVEDDPELLYSITGIRNHRLVIHELCKLISFPLHHPDFSGEISDDEEDEVVDQRPLSSCLDCTLDDNKHICEFVTFMIEKSHALGPVRVSFPPESPGEDEEDEDNDEANNEAPGEGRTEVHESILTVTDLLGKTPLHILCEHSVETNLLRVLLSNSRENNQNPSAPTILSMITARDSRGSTPLHYLAYSRQCPLASLTLMMDYCEPSPDDILKTDPTLCVDVDGDTPLHWALDGFISTRRVKQLLRYSAAALAVSNSAGKRPFDQFVTNFVDANWKEHEITAKESWDSIQAYLKVFVHAQEMINEAEWLPLHMLSSFNIDLPMVFYDIALHFHKDQLSKQNPDGFLPLHLACQRRNADGSPPLEHEMAFKLLAEYPQAAYKAAGKSKRLPIHYAVESRKPLKLIASLLKAYPNSLNIKDPRTNLWPFLLSAMDNEDSIDTSYSLLRADPSIVQLAISALISKRGQRAAQALRHMDAGELEEHSHRRLRRLIIREGYD